MQQNYTAPADNGGAQPFNMSMGRPSMMSAVNT